VHDQPTPPDPDFVLTLDEALMWLNDRLGRNVGIWVTVRDGFGIPIVRAVGELRHWTEEAATVYRSAPPYAAEREVGPWAYTVGEYAMFDPANVVAMRPSSSANSRCTSGSKSERVSAADHTNATGGGNPLR
jgi:hypothetical protein